MKKIIILVIVLVLIAIGIYVVTKSSSVDTAVGEQQEVVNDQMEEQKEQPKTEEVIGKSVEDRDITAYYFGEGEKEILLVGGIHGGYEWNTSLLSYEMIDYLGSNPEIVPDSLKVTVIPVLNPDGLYKVTGKEGIFTASDVSEDTVPGRFNANEVDLNRNFDCDWQEDGTWQNKTVSGGGSAFSEPESKTLKSYVESNNPQAVIVYYSSANGVFASSCHNGILEEAKDLTNTYSEASGYPAYEEFDFYQITGDAVNWLAKNKVPAISVLLTNHTSTELEKNKKGLEAVLEYYSK